MNLMSSGKALEEISYFISYIFHFNAWVKIWNMLTFDPKRKGGPLQVWGDPFLCMWSWCASGASQRNVCVLAWKGKEKTIWPYVSPPELIFSNRVINDFKVKTEVSKQGKQSQLLVFQRCVLCYQVTGVFGEVLFYTFYILMWFELWCFCFVRCDILQFRSLVLLTRE